MGYDSVDGGKIMRGFRVLFFCIIALVISFALLGCGGSGVSAQGQTGLLSVSYTGEGVFVYEEHGCGIYTHFTYTPPPPGEFPVKEAKEQYVVVRAPVCMVEPHITWEGKDYKMAYAYIDGSIPYADYTFVLPESFSLDEWDPDGGFKAVHREEGPLSEEIPANPGPMLLQ